MPSAFRLAVLLVMVCLPLSGPARAEPVRDFDRTLFNTAQHTGRRVMVIVASRWSPVTELQRPVLRRLSQDMLYPDVLFLNVDFERMSDVARSLKVSGDGTIIVFRGTEERARSVGVHDEAELRHMLDVAQ